MPSARCTPYFAPQVKLLKMTCFNKLRNISKMRKFLTIKQLSVLTNAVILLALDYCNSLYYGCSHSSVIFQLQTIQNRCHVIFGLRKYHIISVKSYKSKVPADTTINICSFLLICQQDVLVMPSPICGTICLRD